MEELPLKVPIKITDDMRHLLECRSITLEAVFLEAQAPWATAIVFQIDPARSLVKDSVETTGVPFTFMSAYGLTSR